MKFWSDKVRIYLQQMGRQDVIDRGDDLAERVAALVLTSLKRLEQYAEIGHLYDGQGGTNLLGNDSNSISRIEEFVNVRLRQEIGALEQLLEIFDDLNTRPDW